MTSDPLLLTGDVEDATARLLRTVTAFGATDLADHPAAPAMVLRFAGSGCHDLAIGDPEGAPTVTGPAPELAAWLIGRGASEVLTITPESTPSRRARATPSRSGTAPWR